ncbi:MAG: DUF4350 domain-containing protein [Pseudomonadota bacterium]
MSDRAASPFSRAGMLAILVVGFGVFLAILYMIGSGNTGPENSGNGGAHAASNGLNGYSALVDLVEADGFDARRSRSASGLDTDDLLVLTPPKYMDPEELEQIIERREYRGPTLVILPKWNALPTSFLNFVETTEEVQDGWVLVSGISAPQWAEEETGMLALSLQTGGMPGAQDAEDELPSAFAEAISGEADEATAAERKKTLTENPQTFRSLFPLDELSGSLPTSIGFYSEPDVTREPLIVDQEGRMIAFSYEGASYFDDPDERYDEDFSATNWVVFVVEPDLVNNWGLADETRATAALSIVRNMNWGDVDSVVFDLTLNGFGGTINLLTLAFQPPFLAATICLLLAMLIVGWRAFLRFGPAAARERETAFGKARLVTNGADLIVRAGRLRLLAEPYITLSAHRIARSLGLAKTEPEAIDAALAVRAPGEPSFTARANELRKAAKPTDILRAARALNQTTR